MTSRRTLLLSASAVIALPIAVPMNAYANEPMPVVASFSILGDMVKRIGGEHVALTTLVGPDGDTHVYQPTPKDARAVSDARLLFVNGLEFEGWLDRLSEAANFDGDLVVATTGVTAIAYDEHAEGEHHDEHDDEHHDEHAEREHHDEHHDEHAEGEHHDEHHDEHAEGEHHDEHHDEHAEGEHHDEHGHGAFDPHAWQSLQNALIYVDNITTALAKADPGNAEAFFRNRADYVEDIETLDGDIHSMIEALPEDRRTVVTSHDAFQYFGRAYGLTFLAPQGLSTESEASAKDVARLIEQMREESIAAVFIETISDPRMLEQIANETDAVVGGVLYPGALSGPDGPAPTYLDMLRHNATTLTAALGS